MVNRKVYDQRYYQSHKGVHSESNRKRRERNSRLFAEWMSDKKCTWPDCDVSDPDMLTLDHRDPTTKKRDVGAMVRASYAWSTIEAEISKCRILCANHHHKHTIQQFGYKKWRTDN